MLRLCTSHRCTVGTVLKLRLLPGNRHVTLPCDATMAYLIIQVRLKNIEIQIMPEFCIV